MEYTEEDLKAIKQAINEWADEQFQTSCWTDIDTFVDSMLSAKECNNETLFEDCINNLEYAGYEIDRENQEVVSLIYNMIAERADILLKTYDPEDFEEEYYYEEEY